jgi:2-polyprenyl-3-methyl-5-hydroxy-6-metoxy-1,4-benzoquinol methylase
MVPDRAKHALRRILRRPPSPVTPVPPHMASLHRDIDEARLATLRESIQKNYHVGWRSRESYSQDSYREDLHAHLQGRYLIDRNVVAPWLDSIRKLSESKILEIGCGTGSSTVALAEQGARVVGLDIDEGALEVARDRCRMHEVTADIRVMNAGKLSEAFQHGEFDLILFFACLEHMTIDERLASLSQAWELLPEGGLLGVVDTPNRLWLQDHHTSQMPFFHWLPDELAFQYSRFSARENFREIYRARTEHAFEHFLRRGRGVSFHEFDLAIRPVQHLSVAGSLAEYREAIGIRRPDAAYETFREMLRQQAPDVHRVFFERDLELVIRKSAND